MNLATKHRPIETAEIAGQDHIQRILGGLFNRYAETGEFPSCILIHGAWGSGKTTTARMIARYLNCAKGPREVCGVKKPCDSCTLFNADQDSHPAYIEIDAASNRGINEVRNLQARLQFKCPYPVKVVTLDEMHQLSGDAASALLKTLEEGQEDTVFILCTTERAKVLDTIASRSFRIQVNNLSDDALLGRLAEIAKREKMDVKNQVLESVVSFSNGHARDAIQLLETTWVYCDRGTVTSEAVLRCSGYGSFRTASDIVDSFVTQNSTKLLNTIKESKEDPLQVVRTVLAILHQDINKRFKTNTSEWADVADDTMISLNALFMNANYSFQINRLSLYVLVYWFNTWKAGGTTLDKLTSLK